MISLIIVTTIFFLIFVILSLLVFYTIGFIFIRRSQESLEDQETIALSFCLGIVLFLLTAVFFGLLHLRFLVLPLLLLIAFFVIVKFKTRLVAPWRIFRKNKLLLGLILLGILVQGFINFPSGFLYKDGLYFWSSQGHDGLWHVALMEEVKNSFPPQNPVFSGHGLYNYHYLVDVVMGEFYRIFPFFSPLDLYFRFFPVIFSFLIGMSVFAFVSRWQKNKEIGYLAIFFTYFVGSFGYIVTYLKSGKIFAGESIFWATQTNSIIGNPPHAMSFSLLTCFFLSFLFFLRRRGFIWFFVSLLFAGFLSGFKISAGAVVLIGLIFASLVDMIFNRKFSAMILFLFIGVSNFVLIKLITRSVSSFLIFEPWWFIRTMVVGGNQLDWLDLELRRQHYVSKGTWHAWLRVVQLETTAFLIFLVGNLGIRIVGFFEVIRRIIFGKGSFLRNPLEILIFSAMLSSFLIPLLFVQKGIAYNNIQFMQYFLLIFGFYAAISTYKILNFFKIKWTKVFFLGLVICLGIPTVIGNFNEFYGPGTNPLSKISKQELDALLYLRENSKLDEVVLTMPFNKYAYTRYKVQPWPIYAWYNTAYVFIFSNRHTYLADEDQLTITGYDIEDKLKKISDFFKNGNIEQNKKFLAEGRISYVYLAKDEVSENFDPLKHNLSLFFENKDTIIYKVDKS